MKLLENDWFAVLSVAPSLTLMVIVLSSLSVGLISYCVFMVVGSFVMYGIYLLFVSRAKRPWIAYTGFQACQMLGILMAIKLMSFN